MTQNGLKWKCKRFFVFFFLKASLRLGDRIRKNFKREIGTFLKQSFIEDLAIGTTQGNLSPMRRRIYLPLLTTFLEDILTSVLDPRPRNRLSLARGQQVIGDILNEIFCVCNPISHSYLVHITEFTDLS